MIPAMQLSSNDAEIWAAANCQASAIHIANLATEWGKPQNGPMPFHVDNSVCVQQAKEGCFLKNSKSYARRIAYIQANERDNLFDTSHVDTRNMPADFFGKWLPVKDYRRARAHAMNLHAQVAM